MIRFKRDRSRGQSLVEFALVAPLFLAVVIAIAEGGYYVISASLVNHATHEGARLGVLASTGSDAAIRTRVQGVASPVLSIPDGDIRLQLAELQADGTWGSASNCDDSCYTSRESGDRLKVATDYTHTPLVGYVFPAITFPANAEAELLVEGDPA